MLGLAAHPVLIAGSEEQLEQARVRLARVGIEVMDGYLQGGVEAWKQAGLPAARLSQMTVDELNSRLRSGEVEVLDVRRGPEWEAAHIENATWWPLDNFKIAPPEMDRNASIAVHCKSGYRSMIACSLLQRAGFSHIANVIGGFDAWQEAKLPTAIVIPEKVGTR